MDRNRKVDELASLKLQNDLKDMQIVESGQKNTDGIVNLELVLSQKEAKINELCMIIEELQVEFVDLSLRSKAERVILKRRS
jgi:hypothetical protein